MGEYSEKKESKEVKIEDIVVLLLDIIVKFTNVQKGLNTVLTNGNNNEVQIPNEQGDGSNIQV